MMGLLDKGINPVKGYINFQDLLLHISSLNNYSVYEVIRYLLYHELYSIKTYYTDIHHRQVRSSTGSHLAKNFLELLSINFHFTNNDWVFSNYESINELPDKTRQSLLLTFLQYERLSFKIADLMRFEPLKDLLHFDVSYYDQVEYKQTKLSENQKILITYAVLTPHQIACLLSDISTDDSLNNDNDEYKIYREMVYAAIKNSDLISINNMMQIKAEQVKVWLAKLDFVFKGFNDDLKNSYDCIDGLILDYKKRIADLTAENDRLNKQLSKQADKPADDEQLQGFAKYNADKAYVIATSKALASYLWGMDNTQVIRTGDMVQQVRQVMHNIEPNLLPDNKAIREWLSSIAPEYAKKGGKPSNNAPNEIPLIMKK